jgi:shikimate kinase/3-dehydroquinate synthase
VITDPDVLATLPPAEQAAGYAEVVKTALIAGGALWARVRQGGEVDESVVLGCLRTKLDVVAADERDEGARQALNLGHTIGHAIEQATSYRRYRHGEAVAIGLLAALRLSEREPLLREVEELFRARGLPVQFEGPPTEAVLEAIGRDKKRVAGEQVPFVLVESPGAVTPGHVLDERQVRAAIEEMRAR